VIARSEVAPSAVSLSVAALFPGFGSVVPAGAVAVAVFDSVPVALDRIGAVTVYVADELEVRLTVVVMLPVPDAAPQAPEPVTAHVQLTPATLNTLGSKGSATAALTTSDGPAFDTTIVYVTLWPGTAETTPSVFVIARSEVAPSAVSLSVAAFVPRIRVGRPGRSAHQAPCSTRCRFALDRIGAVTV